MCSSSPVYQRCGISNDTRNNDWRSWQLPSVSRSPPSELSFNSWASMPVVQPRGWLEYYMILITKVCPSRGRLRWSLTVRPARSSLIVSPNSVRSRDSTRRSAEYTSKTWLMVRSSRSSRSREPRREESQWDCALPTSGWRYRFFSSEQSGIHGNSSWCTAREARSHWRVALFRSVHVARNFSIVFDHAQEEMTTGHLAVKSFPPDCASKRYRCSCFFFLRSLLVRFLPTISVMPKHLSRNANVFPRHKLFSLSCQQCFWTVCTLVHDLLRSDVRVIIPRLRDIILRLLKFALADPKTCKCDEERKSLV